MDLSLKFFLFVLLCQIIYSLGLCHFESHIVILKDYVNGCSLGCVLPASRITEMSLAEHHTIEGRGKLKVDNHPRLFTGNIQASYLRHIVGLLSPGSYRLKLTLYSLKYQNMKCILRVLIIRIYLYFIWIVINYLYEVEKVKKLVEKPYFVFLHWCHHPRINWKYKEVGAYCMIRLATVAVRKICSI